MDFVSKSEVPHRREDLAKCIGNLCHGRYLPVEVPAINRYKKACVSTPRKNIPTSIYLSLNTITALSNLRFSIVFVNCGRCGTEKVSCLKSPICRFSRRGVVIRQTTASK